MFFKNLQMELTAKKMWEFTDIIKESIWNNEFEDTVIESYKWEKKNNKHCKFGWQLEAEPIFEAFEKAIKEHLLDYLSTPYIQLRFAYNYWKQYEHEWNLKYKDYIK